MVLQLHLEWRPEANVLQTLSSAHCALRRRWNLGSWLEEVRSLRDFKGIVGPQSLLSLFLSSSHESVYSTTNTSHDVFSPQRQSNEASKSMSHGKPSLFLN